MTEEQKEVWKIFALPLSIFLFGFMFSYAILHTNGVPFKGLPADTSVATTGGSQQGIQGQQQQANQQQPTTQQPAPGSIIKVADRANEPTIGNKSAKVTVVEFADFQCPYCKNFFSQSFSTLKTKYIDTGKIKYVFRHFPLPFHQNAEIAAEAGECANQQGKFWQYNDVLYTKGNGDGTGLASADLKKYASDLGLNTGTFNQCLDSNATASIVKADLAEGTKDGVTGTPAFYINGVQILGAQPTSIFEQAIDAALKNN
jgi:protein-disulfide isomerase